MKDLHGSNSIIDQFSRYLNHRLLLPHVLQKQPKVFHAYLLSLGLTGLPFGLAGDLVITVL